VRPSAAIASIRTLSMLKDDRIRKKERKFKTYRYLLGYAGLLIFSLKDLCLGHIKTRTCPEPDSSWEISPFILPSKIVCFRWSLEMLYRHYIHALISYCDIVVYDNV